MLFWVSCCIRRLTSCTEINLVRCSVLKAWWKQLSLPLFIKAMLFTSMRLLQLWKPWTLSITLHKDWLPVHAMTPTIVFYIALLVWHLKSRHLKLAFPPCLNKFKHLVVQQCQMSCFSFDWLIVNCSVHLVPLKIRLSFNGSLVLNIDLKIINR